MEPSRTAGKQLPAALPLVTAAGQPVSNTEIRFQFFLPKSYRDDGTAWPLLLFLHGAGERGNDLELVKKHGPPKLVETNSEFPCVVASPQCPEHQRWNPAELIQLVQHLVASYRIDERRLYVTGLSMGGYGTWALCAEYPNTFSAAVPICGGGKIAAAEKLKSLPLWVFHGQKDGIVPIRQSEEMVQAVEAVGGKVKFTVYPDTGHDSWTETYNNQAVYDWLLEQKRN
jgi:predicted peptidase